MPKPNAPPAGTLSYPLDTVPETGQVVDIVRA
jgi:hypothetical protein